MTMTKQLNETQIATLKVLFKEGERSSYPGLKRGTLAALQSRGLVVSRGGLGAMFSPATGIKWRISAAGERLIKELGEGN